MVLRYSFFLTWQIALKWVRKCVVNISEISSKFYFLFSTFKLFRTIPKGQAATMKSLHIFQNTWVHTYFWNSKMCSEFSLRIFSQSYILGWYLSVGLHNHHRYCCGFQNVQVSLHLHFEMFSESEIALDSEKRPPADRWFWLWTGRTGSQGHSTAGGLILDEPACFLAQSVSKKFRKEPWTNFENFEKFANKLAIHWPP